MNSKNANKGSLERIFRGFKTLSKTERIEYLKYLILVIERERNLSEKNRLIRFKNRLEKVKNDSAKRLKTLENIAN